MPKELTPFSLDDADRFDGSVDFRPRPRDLNPDEVVAPTPTYPLPDPSTVVMEMPPLAATMGPPKLRDVPVGDTGVDSIPVMVSTGEQDSNSTLPNADFSY